MERVSIEFLDFNTFGTSLNIGWNKGFIASPSSFVMAVCFWNQFSSFAPLITMNWIPVTGMREY